MSIKKLILEILSSEEYRYRVYKKSIDDYRVEEKINGTWKEIEKDESIKNVVMIDCKTVVEEDGRQDVLKKTGQSSSDVAVHAWIECNSYMINKHISSSDGTLYYNPYMVTQFLDRESFENKSPEVIEKCKYVSTDGNHLVYKDATKTKKDDDVVDNNMYLLKKLKKESFLLLRESFYN